MGVRRKRLGDQSVRCGAQEAEGRPGAFRSERRAVSTELGMLVGTHTGEHQRYSCGHNGHAGKQKEGTAPPGGSFSKTP